MDDVELYRRVNGELAAGRRVVTATVVRTQGSTPRKAGAKMLVCEDGTRAGTICGGCVEAEVYQEAVAHFSVSKPRLLRYTLNDDAAAEFGLRCGGIMEIYLERIMPRIQLYLVGAGHIAEALARLAPGLGFDVHVCDDHPGFLTAERLPGASLHEHDFATLGSIIPEGPHVAVVIATRGHRQDGQVFEQLIGRRLGYLGLVSSWKRLFEFYRPLVDRGVTLDQLKKVAAPVGLDIGSETPEEIAIAIAAELLATFRGGERRSLSSLFWDSPAAHKLLSGDSAPIPQSPGA